MKNKSKTIYRIENGLLYREDQKTDIYISDDYFFRDGSELFIYIEDGFLFQEKKLLPFVNFFKVSNPIGAVVDDHGIVWSETGSVQEFDSFFLKAE